VREERSRLSLPLSLHPFSFSLSFSPSPTHLFLSFGSAGVRTQVLLLHILSHEPISKLFFALGVAAETRGQMLVTAAVSWLCSCFPLGIKGVGSVSIGPGHSNSLFCHITMLEQLPNTGDLPFFSADGNPTHV
jgi:hypothetical protein